MIHMYLHARVRECKMYAQKILKKSCEKIWSVKNKYIHLHQQNQ